MAQPKFLDDPAFRCLRIGDLNGFQQQLAGRKELDLSDCDLRGVDFRGLDLGKVLLRGSYLRDADLRGVDLRHIDMEGCSMYHAKVSGAYFPTNLSAAEIGMSVQYGTRVRCEGLN
jgi:uncharacterized protein YjbI with pentapeptide repeats